MASARSAAGSGRRPHRGRTAPPEDLPTGRRPAPRFSTVWIASSSWLVLANRRPAATKSASARAGDADGQVDQPAAAQRAGRPDRSPARSQHADRPAEVVQGRRVPAQIPEHDAAPVQYPSHQHAGGPAGWPDRRRQVRPPSGPRRRALSPGTPAHRPRVRPHRSGGPVAARGAARVPRHGHHRYRAGRSRRPDGPQRPHTGQAGRQNRPRPGQCLMRTGQGQQQQIVHIGPTGSGGKCARATKPMLVHSLSGRSTEISDVLDQTPLGMLRLDIRALAPVAGHCVIRAL